MASANENTPLTLDGSRHDELKEMLQKRRRELLK